MTPLITTMCATTVGATYEALQGERDSYFGNLLEGSRRISIDACIGFFVGAIASETFLSDSEPTMLTGRAAVVILLEFGLVARYAFVRAQIPTLDLSSYQSLRCPKKMNH